MYCGQCNNYIPDGLLTCPGCGINLEEAAQLAQEKKKNQEAAELREARLEARNQRSFNYFQALFYSFFSPLFYRHVFRSWKGTGILYFGFMIAVSSLPFMIGTQTYLRTQAWGNLDSLIDQIPTLSFSGGRFSFEGKNPYGIRHPKTGNMLALLDREETPKDFSKVPAMIFLSPTHAAFQLNRGEHRIFAYPDSVQVTVRRDQIRYWAGQLERFLVYLVCPWVWFVMWIAMGCVALVYTIPAKLMALFFKVPAPFKPLFRLTLVAFTPALILDAVSTFWRVQGLPDAVSFSLPLLFILLGIGSNRGTAVKGNPG